MTINVYYSDLKDCAYVQRNLLYALLEDWVTIKERGRSFVVVEGAGEVLNSLYEPYPKWLTIKAYN
jgi:hypothetical protein